MFKSESHCVATVYQHDNRDDLDYEEDRRATDRERVAAWRTRGWRPPPREWRDRPPARRFREAPAREPEREREGQRERESEREPTAREPENNKSEADADDDGEPAPKRSNLDTIPRRTYMDWEEDRHDSRPSRGGRAMWTGKWQRTRGMLFCFSYCTLYLIIYYYCTYYSCNRSIVCYCLD